MTALREKSGFQQMDVLGVPISLVDLPRATETVCAWAREARPRTVFVREVASLMLAVDQPELRRLHDEADLIVADGAPLALIGKLRGYGDRIGRIPGADLVDAVCAASLQTGQSHYFYGGKPGVAQKMVERLSARYPGLAVAGVYSPPMREVGPDFELGDDVRGELEHVRGSRADFIWVGISSPKQEYWMTKAAPVVGRGVFFGVGAAFDFHSEAVRRAPLWMRDGGLEWLHRLISEPRRLWRRYLLMAPRFVWMLTRSELTGGRKPQGLS